MCREDSANISIKQQKGFFSSFGSFCVVWRNSKASVSNLKTAWPSYTAAQQSRHLQVNYTVQGSRSVIMCFPSLVIFLSLFTAPSCDFFQQKCINWVDNTRWKELFMPFRVQRRQLANKNTTCFQVERILFNKPEPLHFTKKKKEKC